MGGGYILWQLLFSGSKSLNSSNSVHNAAQFGTLDIPLGELSQTGQLSLDSSRTLNINGQLKVNNGFVLAPSDQPTSGVAGQMYYDRTTNQLNYYNGSGFVSLTNNPQTVTSINGTAGTFTLGGGLSLNGTQLRNSGVVSVTSASNNLAVANDGSGNITLNETSQAGVQSQSGTTGHIAFFTSPQTISDSLLSQSGGAVSVAGDVTIAGATSINGGATIAGTLNLQQTGQTTINLGETTSGVTGQIYNDGNLHVTGGQNNLWLDAGGAGTLFLNASNGNPVAINEVVAHGSYPLEVNGDVNLTSGHSYRINGTVICSIAGCTGGGGGGGVSSLDGLSGALTLANSSGSGTTVTIDDASTTQKGIASFNSTNFTTTSGAVNTVQNINSGATPTFAGVNTNSINPSGALTVGATSQSFTLQGTAASVINASNGVNSTTLAFQSPTANVTYRFATAAAGTYDICTMVGNCAGSGGGVTTAGGTPGTLPVFTGAQAIGDSLLSQSGSTVTVSGNLNLTGGNTYRINGSQISSANLSNDGNLAKLNGTQTFTGATNTFQNASDSTLAFSIQNASNQKVLSINTTAGTAILGQGGALNGQLVFNNSSNTNTITLVPSAASSNQTLTLPDGSGTICISTGNCGGAGVTLQAAYNNSSSPQITLDAVHAGLTVRDNATPISGNLLAVQNNAGGTTYFAVTATGTSVSGSSTTSGNINSSGGGLQTGGTTRVDNAGNLINIGTITSGLINGQTISSSANFTGSVAVASGISTNSINPTGALTIGATGQSFTLQGNASSTVTATGGGFATTIGFTGSPVGAVTYNFDRSASAGTYTICTTIGNCAGTGSGVTTSGGTTNKIAKFTASQAIGNSSISDTGSSVSITPGSDTTAVFQVQNAAGRSVLNVDTSGSKITLGNVTSTSGQGVAGNLIFADGTNDNFGATLSTATLSANRSITIPNASGTVAVSASGPLSLDAAGNLTCPSCVTSGGGGGGAAAVDSLDGLTGTLTLANSTGSGTTVTINNASTSQKGIAQFNSTNFSASGGVINTIQDISSASSPTFAGITVNTITQNYSASSGTGNTLSVTDSASSGTTTVKGQSINITGTANNTGSNTITGLDFGNVAAATNNTYYGINFGTGFNDLLRYNGTTLITGGGLINGGQLQSASVANGSLANSSLTVTAGNGLTGGGSVSLGNSTSLAVAYGSSANTAVQGNVTLTCASGSGNLTGGGNAITLGSGGSCNNISIVNNPTFTGQLTLSGNGSSGTPILNLTGAPTANATTSLVQLGGAISGGNSAVNGGTYLGINLPASGAGSTADFLNLQNNGTVALKVTSAGAVITNLASGAVYSNGGTLTSETNLSVTRGGTGAGSFTSNGILYGNSTGALQVTAAGTSGQCLVGNTGSAPTWTTCTGLVTLQNAYNNSTNPEITLGSASTAGLTIRDNSTPISGNLLEVQNNAGNTNYLAVSSTGISTSGNATVSGSVFSGTLDTASAGALSIGNTNATSVAIGNTSSNISTTINGTAIVKPTSGHDSTTAFQVQNANATPLFNVDTTNSAVSLGSSPTQQAGYTTTGGTANPGANNDIQMAKITTGSAGTMTSIAVYFGVVGSSPNNKFQVALYADNAGSPGAKIASSGDNVITARAWNTIPLSASLSASTSYWIGIEVNSAATATAYTPGGGSYKLFSTGTSYGTWPGTLVGTSADFSSSNSTSAYVNITSGTSYALATDNNGHVAIGTGTTSSLYQLYVQAPTTSQYAAYLQGETTVAASNGEAFNVIDGAGNQILDVDTKSQHIDINGSDTSGYTGVLNIHGDAASDPVLNLINHGGTTTTLQVTDSGATTFQNASDSTSALKVKNAAGTTSVLNVDTTNSNVTAAANSSSTSSPTLTVQQAGSGDATQLFSNATTSFYQGVDTSNGNSFNINAQAAALHGSNLGNDLSSYSTLGADSNSTEAQATQFTAGTTGTLSSLSVSFESGSGDSYSVAIYSDSSNAPGTLLAHGTTGTIATPSSGSSGPYNINWNTMTLNTPVSITSGTKYWLALETQNGGPDQFNLTDPGTGSTFFRGGVTPGTWASSWNSNGTSNDGTDNYKIAIYGQVVAGSVTDTYANSQFNLSTNGSVALKNTTNSNSAFQVQNASGSSVLDVDTENGFVGIGTSNPLVGLDVRNRDIALSKDQVIHFDGATDTNMTLGDFGPQSGSLITGSAAVLTLDGGSTTGFAIQSQTGGPLVTEITGTGQTLFKNSTNSSTAFQIQNAGGASLFTVDTSGGGVKVGSNASSGNTVTIDGGTGASAIQIGNSATNHGIQIGTGAAVQTVTVGSTNSSSGATIQGGTGNVSILTGATSGTSGSISITTGASSTGASGNITIDAGSNVPSGTLLQTKTFESSAENMQAWFNVSSATQSTAQAHTGTHSFAAVESNPAWGIQENYPGTVSVTPGHVYSFSAWVRGTAVETIGANVVFVPGNSVHWGTVTDTTTGWTQITGTAVASAGATTEYINFGSGTGTGSATTYFDDITVQDITASNTPYINIGTANAQAINIGSSSQTDKTIIQGAGINLTASAGATINIGTTNTNSVVIGDPTNGGSTTLQSVGITNVLGSGSDTITTSNNTATALQILDASAATALAVSTNNVATGANAANATLKVAKDSGTGRSINAAGTINASGADYAEYFHQATPGALQKGDVVCLNAQSQAEACSGGSGTLIGAVSSNPGYVGNDIYDPKHPDNTALVGLLGQIQVKVSDANGAIYAGDPLTMSSTPGVAVKATSAGMVLGTALENSSAGTGEINVYVHTGYFAPSNTSLQQNNTTSQYVQNGSDAAFTSLNVSGQTTLASLTVTGTATIADLTVNNLVTATLTVNGHIITGGGQPTIASGSAACSGSTVSISGTDTAGLITVTSADSCTASGELAKITFAHAFGSAPRVTLTAGNASAAALQTYVDSSAISPTSFTIATPTSTINGSTTYKWYYQVLQ